MPRPETGLIVIGKPSSDHVVINITDRDSENWLRGTLEIKVGAWYGRCGVSFYGGELRDFAHRLERVYRDLVGTAELIPIEPYVQLRFSGNGKGLVAVDGRAQDQLGSSTFVSFALELDQTELPAIATALEGVDPT
jgi:hypothetical protein